MTPVKHKINAQVPVEKRALLGIKKTVVEIRTIEVDGKTKGSKESILQRRGNDVVRRDL